MFREDRLPGRCAEHGVAPRSLVSLQTSRCSSSDDARSRASVLAPCGASVSSRAPETALRPDESSDRTGWSERRAGEPGAVWARRADGTRIRIVADSHNMNGPREWRVRLMDCRYVPGAPSPTCLIFDGESIARRVWAPPSQWELLSDAALLALLDRPQRWG